MIAYVTVFGYLNHMMLCSDWLVDSDVWSVSIGVCDSSRLVTLNKKLVIYFVL